MRLANGSGSIVCLDRSGTKRRKPWAVRITTGWKNGKQVRKYVGYYHTQAEAIIALAEYHKTGYDLDLSKLTLNEVFEKWIERVKKRDISDSVLRMHNVARSRFGRLGNMEMNKIKAQHLQNWLDEIDLKPATKKRIRNTMSQLFEYAISNDIVSKNYAQSLEVTGKIEKTGAVFTEKELEVLWNNQDHPVAKQLLVMIYTGMRIGELLEVKREDIRFDEGYLIGGIKTEAGRDRVIPLHPRIIPFVKELLGDNHWLMQSSRGDAPVSYPTTYTKHMEFFKQHDMVHKPHDCRKTAVSIMHSAGIPIETVRVIVGHSGKGVTEKVYLYKSAKELVDAIKTVEIPY